MLAVAYAHVLSFALLSGLQPKLEKYGRLPTGEVGENGRIKWPYLTHFWANLLIFWTFLAHFRGPNPFFGLFFPSRGSSPKWVFVPSAGHTWRLGPEATSQSNIKKPGPKFNLANFTPQNAPRPSKTQERKRHLNINTFFRWLPGWGGASRPGGQGSPDRWPKVKSSCAVCGTQGT